MSLQNQVTTIFQLNIGLYSKIKSYKYTRYLSLGNNIDKQMSESVILDKTNTTLESTQEALNILRNLRQKRKKESPASLYELVKQIYGNLKDPNHKKGLAAETISSDEYLGNNRESIEDMLLYIRDKTGYGLSVHSSTNTGVENNSETVQSKEGKLMCTPQMCSNCLKGQNSTNYEDEVNKLKQNIKQKQENIEKLNQTVRHLEHQSKTMQIKLLNNIKRLNVQLQQKDAELHQIKQILRQKDQQIDQLNKLNEKKHKKIRKLEEDLYDLQLQLEQRNQELQAERECADFFEKKIGKVLEIQSHFSQISHNLQNKHEICQENDYKSQIGIQTDCQSASMSNSSEPNQPTLAGQKQNQNDDKASQCSSKLTQSKQSKYIESIQRLTAQLGEAYQTINELMKQGNLIDPSQAIDMLSAGNISLGAAKNGKSKTKSGYFSKLWK